jgi:hypothetical protein
MTTKKIATDDLLALLCKALSERYPDDPTAPGVQIAHLSGPRFPSAQWYVACHRYTGSFGQGRLVVAQHRGEYLDVVLEQLAKRVAESTPKVVAQRELKKAVDYVPAEEMSAFAADVGP